MDSVDRLEVDSHTDHSNAQPHEIAQPPLVTIQSRVVSGSVLLNYLSDLVASIQDIFNPIVVASGHNVMASSNMLRQLSRTHDRGTTSTLPPSRSSRSAFNPPISKRVTPLLKSTRKSKSLSSASSPRATEPTSAMERALLRSAAARIAALCFSNTSSRRLMPVIVSVTGKGPSRVQIVVAARRRMIYRASGRRHVVSSDDSGNSH